MPFLNFNPSYTQADYLTWRFRKAVELIIGKTARMQRIFRTSARKTLVVCNSCFVLKINCLNVIFSRNFYEELVLHTNLSKPSTNILRLRRCALRNAYCQTENC